MLNEKIGEVRLFDRPVEFWFKGAKCVVRAKFPMVGWKEGELTAEDLAALASIITVAQAKLTEAACQGLGRDSLSR